MLPLTHEWVGKAEDDLTMALRELRARKKPSYDGACFHSQQCAEKYMKALLEEAGITIPRTHNLAALLDLVLPLDPSWDLLRPHLTVLSGYAVAIRYPGNQADRPTARDSVRVAQAARDKARLALGLP